MHSRENRETEAGLLLRGWREVWRSIKALILPVECGYFIHPPLQLSSRPMNGQVGKGFRAMPLQVGGSALDCRSGWHCTKLPS